MEIRRLVEPFRLDGGNSAKIHALLFRRLAEIAAEFDVGEQALYQSVDVDHHELTDHRTIG